MTLTTFPPRSQVRCCGTCSRWYVDERRRTVCREQVAPLPDDLTACGCAAWRQERMETDARELYAALREELRG
jgi:hypothetical protein